MRMYRSEPDAKDMIVSVASIWNKYNTCMLPTLYALSCVCVCVCGTNFSCSFSAVYSIIVHSHRTTVVRQWSVRNAQYSIHIVRVIRKLYPRFCRCAFAGYACFPLSPRFRYSPLIVSGAVCALICVPDFEKSDMTSNGIWAISGKPASAAAKKSFYVKTVKQRIIGVPILLFMIKGV